MSIKKMASKLSYISVIPSLPGFDGIIRAAIEGQMALDQEKAHADAVGLTLTEFRLAQGRMPLLRVDWGDLIDRIADSDNRR